MRVLNILATLALCSPGLLLIGALLWEQATSTRADRAAMRIRGAK